MELYNHHIEETRGLLHGEAKAWDYEGLKKWKDLGSSELVLQKDAAYELGDEVVWPKQYERGKPRK